MILTDTQTLTKSHQQPEQLKDLKENNERLKPNSEQLRTNVKDFKENTVWVKQMASK